MKGFIKKFYQRFICKHDYHLIGETKEFHTYSDIFIYRCSKCGKIKLKSRKHFIRKYELLARCIQTNLELFILQ